MNELEGAFDLHVHCSPDARPRKMTALELARAAKAAGMGGLLLKNHDVPTVALAEVVRESVPGLAVFGGLVLNDSIGGWNVAAVDVALRMGAKQIWMPTRSAANERRYLGEAGGLSVLDDGGRVLPKVRDILELIARAGAILGTAHLSPHEIVMLVAEARAAGVRRVLVSHPEIAMVNLTVSLQREIAGPDVFFERCYARKGFVLDWAGLAAVTTEIGFVSSILATDLGQPENVDPINGLLEMRREFARHGFTEAQLRTMMCETPRRLLDL